MIRSDASQRYHLSMMFLKPTYLIDGDITDIDLDRLAADGIRGLILDLDSTLVAPCSGVLTEEVQAWLKRARSMFQMAIVSNNKRDPYLEQIRSLVDIPTIGRAAKPRRGGFRQALEILELEPQEVAVVGDRPLTDVWGGQRAGMKTVLVRPLKTMTEPGWITFFRNLERLVIKS
jgi:HAD superfamily phosphatase (TIGR01668 family)